MLETITSLQLSQVPSPRRAPGLSCKVTRTRTRRVDPEKQRKKTQWSSLISAFVGYTGVSATI